MTLEKYLNSLPANPLDADSPALYWINEEMNDDLKPPGSYGSLPYAVIFGLDEITQVEFHSGVTQVNLPVYVRLYQPPEKHQDRTRTPSKRVLRSLYECVLLAYKSVDAMAGAYSFVQIRKLNTQEPPRKDPATLGLTAQCRFNLTFRRA